MIYIHEKVPEQYIVYEYRGKKYDNYVYIYLFQSKKTWRTMPWNFDKLLEYARLVAYDDRNLSQFADLVSVNDSDSPRE